MRERLKGAGGSYATPDRLFNSLGAASANLPRPHDESLGSSAHQRERITGNQSQNGPLGHLQDPNILGPDHFDGFYKILVRFITGDQPDPVVQADLPQPPKERVPVAGQTCVARFARRRRARNMSDAPLQRFVVDAFLNDGGQADPGDFHTSDQGTLGERETNRREANPVHHVSFCASFRPLG